MLDCSKSPLLSLKNHFPSSCGLVISISEVSHWECWSILNWALIQPTFKNNLKYLSVFCVSFCIHSLILPLPNKTIINPLEMNQGRSGHEWRASWIHLDVSLCIWQSRIHWTKTLTSWSHHPTWTDVDTLKQLLQFPFKVLVLEITQTTIIVLSRHWYFFVMKKFCQNKFRTNSFLLKCQVFLHSETAMQSHEVSPTKLDFILLHSCNTWQDP